MGAKSKLNGAYLNGALLIAGTVGLISGSWTVFVVCLVLLVLSSILAGEIRGGVHGGRG